MVSLISRLFIQGIFAAYAKITLTGWKREKSLISQTLLTREAVTTTKFSFKEVTLISSSSHESTKRESVQSPNRDPYILLYIYKKHFVLYPQTHFRCNICGQPIPMVGRLLHKKHHADELESLMVRMIQNQTEFNEMYGRIMTIFSKVQRK